MKHLRDLKVHYNKALGAKRDCVRLLSTHLQDKIHTTQLHDRLGDHTAATAEGYSVAKHDTCSPYTDSATWVALTNKHQAYMRRSHNMLRTYHHNAKTLYDHVADWLWRQQLEQQAHTTMHTPDNTNTHLIR